MDDHHLGYIKLFLKKTQMLIEDIILYFVIQFTIIFILII
jgi:hypothetical protein